MFNKFMQLIAPPIFEDENKTRVASLLNTILWLVISLTIISSILTLVIDENPIPSLIFITTIALLEFGMLLLNRWGYVKIASFLFSILIWAALAFAVFFFGGVRSTSFNAFIISILISGLLLGGEAAIFFSILSIIAGGGMYYAEIHNYLTPNTESLSLINAWVGQSLTFIMAALMLHQAVHKINDALNRAQQNEKALAKNNYTLQNYTQELERREKALHTSEARWRSLVYNAPTLIITTTLDGTVEFVNTSPSKASNIPHKSIYDFVSPNYYDLVKNTIKKVCKDKKPINYESVSPNSHSENTWFSTRVGPIILNQEVTGLIFIATDITEHKQSEKLLTQYRDHLEDMVAKQTEELSQALENLKKTQNQLVESRKMAALGGLVAGIAHEINTPIGIGITMASTLVEETEQVVDIVKTGKIQASSLKAYLEVADESAKLILSNLNRAVKLIQGFKQVAVDQTNAEKRSFEIKKYLSEILFSLKPKLRRIKHTIEIQGDKDIHLYSYPGEFAQVVTNLVINSLIHAYEEGDEGHLCFNVQQVDNYVKFEYSDDGIGISPENLDKIFDPFFTTARSVGGSGLGLHVVYNLVTQKLQGTIQCESTIGQGTKFIINLPLEINN